MKRALVLILLLAVGLMGGFIAQAVSPPVPEANFAKTLIPSPCTAQTQYEVDLYSAEGWSPADGYSRYGSSCQRLKFTYGPIAIKPGANDIFVAPVTIEKPGYDGYIVRFKPDLVRADGSVPGIEEIHLHHATWLSEIPFPRPSYANGMFPFFASGEEKTIFDIPKGYGMPVFTTDNWQLNYMIHNQTNRPDLVWITYDLDYVATSSAQQLGIKDAYPAWFDVRPGFYPVFNVERKYGHTDSSGRVSCTWPTERCADLDPWGKTFTGQGQSGNGRGTSWNFPNGGSWGRINSFTGGTLIALGGHVHPGGLSVQLDLQRQGQSQPVRIFTSEAKYWDWGDISQSGGPPTSWDMSMTVSGLPHFGIEINPGDTILINATYEASIQSTFENMGIVMAWIAPHASNVSGPGLNPFTAAKDTSEGCASGGLAANPPQLCEKGFVTHGHMDEANNHGGPLGGLPSKDGPQNTTQMTISNFRYLVGDQGLTSVVGIPGISLNSTLRFTNLDSLADVYHSITACAFPCTGATGIAFPLGDGKSSTGKNVEFDSGQLGYGLRPCFESLCASGDQASSALTPAKNTINYDLPVTTANGFDRGASYSFFCRVHPFMRGAFTVK